MSQDPVVVSASPPGPGVVEGRGGDSAEACGGGRVGALGFRVVGPGCAVDIPGASGSDAATRTAAAAKGVGPGLGLIPPEQIDLVRERADIVELIGERLQLTKKGTQFWACCPFHQEKTASFSVHPGRQIFKCFGCQVGGNIFGFLEKYERVSFPEAVRLVADRVGIELTEEKGERRRRRRKRDLLEINEEVCRWFESRLADPRDGAKGREYLERRGITPEMAQLFRIGLAPPGWEGLLQRARRMGIGPDSLETLGLVVRNERRNSLYDRFRDRLIFPICDERGRVIAFGGRRFGDDPGSPKYINSSEVPGIFEKRRVLYGLHLAREARVNHLIIVEGYTDAIMATQAGIPGVVAVLGTAFGPDHVPLVRRFAERVTILFDGDEAGRRAAERSLGPLLPVDLEIRVALLTGGQDPCDAIVAEGAEAFRQKVERAPEVFDVLLENIEAESGGSLVEQARAIERTLKLLAPMDPLRLHLHLGRFAHRFGLSEAELRQKLQNLRGGGSPSGSSAEAGPGRRGDGGPGRPGGPRKGFERRMGPKERARETRRELREERAKAPSAPTRRFGRGSELKLLEALLACPEKAPEVFEILTPRHFTAGPSRDLATRIQVRCDLGQVVSEATLYDEELEPAEVELLNLLGAKLAVGQERNKDYAGELEPEACRRLVQRLRREQRKEIRRQLDAAIRAGDEELAQELEDELDALLAEPDGG